MVTVSHPPDLRLAKAAAGLQTTPLPYAVRNATKDDASRFIANLTAMMLAGGVLGRTALGATRLTGTRKPRYQPTAGQQLSLPRQRPEDDEQPKLAAADQFEVPGTAPLRNAIRSWLHTPADAPTVMSGDYVSDAVPGMPAHMGNPALYYLGLPLGAAAAYGGYKLTDMLLDSRRKSERNSELSDAKRKYEALASSMTKRNAAEEADAMLGELAERAVARLTKQSEREADTMANRAKSWLPGAGWQGISTMAGAYPAYAMGSATLAGLLAHRYFSRRGKRKLTEDAMKEREKRRHTRPLYASLQSAG